MVGLGFKTWNALYEGEDEIKLSVMELASKDKNFLFRRKNLDKIKQKMEGIELSVHTQTKRVFNEDNKTLRELEIKTLRTEILACRYLGANELIVHLKNKKLTSGEVETFSEVLKFARKNGVEILYELNNDFNAENFLYNLSQFPNLNVNLDLCHLTLAIENGTLGMRVKGFLKKIKEKVVYIHASGYDGEKKHVGLEKGFRPIKP